jgi:hypothetical protein
MPLFCYMAIFFRKLTNACLKFVILLLKHTPLIHSCNPSRHGIPHPYQDKALST